VAEYEVNMIWMNKGHEFDSIGKYFIDIEKVFIYGCGYHGTKLAKRLSYCDCVAGFVDRRFSEFPQEGYMGKPVYSQHEFLKLRRENIIVIIAMDNFMGIKKNLVFEGFVEGRNLFDVHTFINIYEKIYYLYRFGKLRADRLGNVVTSLCSLSCKYCNHSLHSRAKREHMDYNDMIRQIDLTFKRFDFIDTYILIGGETFLYPKLYELIRYLMSEYSNHFDIVRIYTNGLFPILNKELIHILLDERIEILWSDYTNVLKDNSLIIKINQNIESLMDYGINVRRKSQDNWVDFSMGQKRQGTNDELKSIYNDCLGCLVIIEDSLQICQFAYIIKKHFMGIEEPFDSISLREESDKAIFLEMMLGFTDNGYARMCRYCAGFESVNNNLIKPGEQI
jgi:organic radical activating enzyme